MRQFLKLHVGKQCIPVLSGIRLAVLIAMSLSVCYYGYRFYSSASGIRATEAAIAQENKAIEALVAEMASTAGSNRVVTPVEPPMDGGKFMSTFIRQITDLSVKTGCKLNTIKPKPIEVVADPNAPQTETIKYKPIEVEIEMHTDFAGVNDFIAGLSGLPKVAKVTEIELSRRSVDTATRRAMLDAKLTLILCMLEPSGKAI